MKVTDTLIIGSGIAGTWLAYWLDYYGHDFLVVDNHKDNSATRVASGVVNPVTGRRLAKTWLDEQIMNESKIAYQNLERKFNISVFNEIELLDFFGAEDKQKEFNKRIQSSSQYLRQPSISEINQWASFFNFNLGIGAISPVYYIHLSNLLSAWHKFLTDSKKLIADYCSYDSLGFVNDKVIYKNEVTANRVIFCDGTNGLTNHFFQNNLPFSFNKGEALIVEIIGLPQSFIYKKGFTIVPWYQPNQFWIGSTYNRNYEDELPGQSFYTDVITWLNNFCKHPYEIIKHISALRPTTKERRPFVGMHPDNSVFGVFNGMGTKGVSLSPVFGKEFALHIIKGASLNPEVDVARFFQVR